MAKSSKHYLKNGTEWKGTFHKMSNGQLHTNKKHTKTSKPIFHYADLSTKARKKANA